MNDHNESYDRYRQADARLAEELSERQRTAGEDLKWERHRQRMRGWGTLDTVESSIRRFHRMWISIERKRGKSRRDAKVYADARIAELRWVLTDRRTIAEIERRMHAWRQLGDTA